MIKYVIFNTKWGHFGLAGTKSVLCRTQLPGPEPKKIESRLLKNLPHAQFDETLFKILQEKIGLYCEGGPASRKPGRRQRSGQKPAAPYYPLPPSAPDRRQDGRFFRPRRHILKKEDAHT